MLRPWLFVGFSGHRKLEQPAVVARALRAVLRQLGERAGAPLAAVSSAAAGADTLFAETAAEFGLPWTALLPFPVEEFQKDFADDPDGWARVAKLLPRAVRTVIEPPTEERSDAYLECGVRTADECDVLLAVWNGEAAAGRGGTGDIVEYVRSQDKPLIWIHSETGEVREERLASFVAPAARTKSAAVPRTPAAAGGAETTGADGRTQLDAAYDFHNDAAKALRPRAVNLNLSLVLLHQLSAAITLTALVWFDQTWLQSPAAWIKTALLVGAFVLPWFFQRAHGEWIVHRLRAEIFRAARAVWKFPVADEILPALRLPVEDRLQRSVLLLRLLTPTPSLGLAAARDEYGTERIAGQLNYFQEHSLAAARQRRRLTLLGRVCTAIAIAIGFAPFFGLLTAEMDPYRTLRNLGWVLPLVTTAALSTVAARDLTRRAARYGELAAFLRRARTQLRHARTWPRFTRVVIEVERTLLLEIWEWYSLARFAPKP